MEKAWGGWRFSLLIPGEVTPTEQQFMKATPASAMRILSDLWVYILVGRRSDLQTNMETAGLFSPVRIDNI